VVAAPSAVADESEADGGHVALAGGRWDREAR
jgi:hypothetical protein